MSFFADNIVESSDLSNIKILDDDELEILWNDLNLGLESCDFEITGNLMKPENLWSILKLRSEMIKRNLFGKMDVSEFMTELFEHQPTRFTKKASPKPEIEHSDGEPSLRRIILDAEDNSKKAECEICLEKFASKQSLNYHKDVEHFGIRYRCQECQKVFRNKQNALKHISIFHADKNVQFEKFVQTESEIPLITPRFITPENTEYQIAISDVRKILPKEGGLDDSISENFEPKMKKIKLDHELAKNVQCELCEQKFASTQALKYHRDVDHLGIRYKCSICEKVYNNRQNTAKHISNFHPNAQNTEVIKFTIDVENKPPVEPQNFVIRNVSGQNSSFFIGNTDASLISVKVGQPESRDDSEPIHFAEYALDPEIDENRSDELICCGNVYRNKYALKQHFAKVHEGLRFKCTECGKLFKEKRRCKGHILNFHKGKEVEVEKISVDVSE
jgi:uncharacterized C2H2 Zn-finger protein